MTIPLRLFSTVTSRTFEVDDKVADKGVKGEQELSGGKKGQYKEIKGSRLQENITHWRQRWEKYNRGQQSFSAESVAKVII